MTQFILYGGKGGVGKTTCAAATGLKLARRGLDTLVVSTDPAHSISDSYDTEVPSEPVKIQDQLYAVEVDPQDAMDDYKGDIQAVPEDLGDADLGLGLGAVGEQIGEDVGGLLEDAVGAPGSDEAAAIYKFMEYMESDDYDYIVFDTAPTGHTLRLLKLPEVMDSMVGRLMKIKSQIKGVVDSVKGMFGKSDEDGKVTMDKLEKLKDRVVDVRTKLQNPEQTDFRVVLIPESMAVLETQRLIEQLSRFEIPVRTVVINKVMEDVNPDCSFCQDRLEVQQDNIQEASRMFRDLKIQHVPLMRDEVKGMETLEHVANNIEVDTEEYEARKAAGDLGAGKDDGSERGSESDNPKDTENETNEGTDHGADGDIAHEKKEGTETDHQEETGTETDTGEFTEVEVEDAAEENAVKDGGDDPNEDSDLEK
ncbi:MAG: TRC40/GET3/ArsA family transport-energizing ATPase [Halobacteria archaeon]